MEGDNYVKAKESAGESWKERELEIEREKKSSHMFSENDKQ